VNDDKISLKPETALGSTLLRWWQGLESDRGARAELRRAHDLTAVALTGSFQRFYRLIVNAGWPEGESERLAALAGLLAHVKVQADKPLTQTMSEGEKPPVSELRFRRLLESPTMDDLFIGLRRVLPLMGHSANIYDLAHSVLFWGDAVKKRWAYNYNWPAKAQG